MKPIWIISLHLTLCFTAAPQALWVARYDGPAQGSDSARGIAVDGAGNVYVTGQSEGRESAEYATIKYDRDGKEIWVARYGAPGGGSAVGLALNEAGNIYVTGRAPGGIVTVAYDPDGTELWVSPYRGRPVGHYPVKIVVDNNGFVYVTGFTMTPGLESVSWFVTIKYAPDGSIEWVREYQTLETSTDRAEDIGVDSEGNVYVTGWSVGPVPYTSVTIKYDANGNQLWLARFDGSAKRGALAKRLAMDSEGNVYVAGYLRRESGSLDCVTVKYDFKGTELWAATFEGASDPVAIAADAMNNIYVAARYSRPVVREDYLTIKYDSEGNQIWTAQYNVIVQVPLSIFLDKSRQIV